jgi:hypothetical protein
MAAEYKVLIRTPVTIYDGDRVILKPTGLLTNAMMGKIFDDHLGEECVIESVELPEKEEKGYGSTYLHVRFEDDQTACFPIDCFILPERDHAE